MTTAFVLTVATGAQAKTITVTAGPGTPVADALAQLADGDKLVFQPGVYTERLLLDGRSRIKVLAKGKGEVVFSTTASSSVQINNCSKVSVKGIVVRDSTSTTGIGVVGSEKVSISRCVLDGLPVTGIGVGAPSSVKISKCTITDAPTAILAAGESQVAISKNTISGAATSVGIQLAVLTAPGSVVSRNTIRDTGSAAIEFGAPGTRIERNVIEGCFFGIVGTFNKDVAGSLLSRNTIRDTEVVALRLLSGGATATGNRIERCGSSAVQCGSSSEPSVLLKNVISTAPNGIDVESPNAVVDKNRVSATQNYAIRVRGGTGVSCTKNVLSGNTGNGFDIWTAGHTLTKNKASDNDGFDITARVTAEELTLVGNKFESENYK